MKNKMSPNAPGNWGGGNGIPQVDKQQVANAPGNWGGGNGIYQGTKQPLGNTAATALDQKAFEREWRRQSEAMGGRNILPDFLALFKAAGWMGGKGGKPNPNNPNDPPKDQPPTYNPNLGGFVNQPASPPPSTPGGSGLYSYVDPNSYNSWLQGLQGTQQQPTNQVNPYDMQRYLDPRYRGGM